jgi:hypothetical protein
MTANEVSFQDMSNVVFNEVRKVSKSVGFSLLEEPPDRPAVPGDVLEVNLLWPASKLQYVRGLIVYAADLAASHGTGRWMLPGADFLLEGSREKFLFVLYGAAAAEGHYLAGSPHPFKDDYRRFCPSSLLKKARHKGVILPNVFEEVRYLLNAENIYAAFMGQALEPMELVL